MSNENALKDTNTSKIKLKKLPGGEICAKGFLVSKWNIMNRVEIRLSVSSINEATKFYCEELALFDFYYDYGMGTVSLSFTENSKFRLILTEGKAQKLESPIFSLETKDCISIFEKLKNTDFKTQGKLISENVFEYPLGKNILLQDPSMNQFLIFEDFYPNIGD